MAVRFDAQNDPLSSTAGLPSGDFSVTCWAMLVTDRDQFSTVWVIEGASSYIILQTLFNGTTMSVQTDTSAGDIDITNGPAMILGTWYGFGVVLAGTTLTMYHKTIDGALATATPITIGGYSVTGFKIGGSTLFSAEWLNGRIAAFKMWNAALTQPEIENELTQYQPTRTTNLTRYHPFVNVELTDYSGNGNILTAGSSATTIEDGPPLRWRVYA